MAAPVISGIGNLGFVTTDASGPNGQEGGYFPFVTSVSLTKTTEISKIFAYPPAGGTGRLKQVASISGTEEWAGTMSINVQSWLELQLLMGQKSQSISQAYFEPKTKTIASNIITDSNLVGVAEADVVVSYIDYDATAGAPVQLEVDVSPATASATKTILDATAGTLTFAAAFEGQPIYYSINKSATKQVIGASSPTVISGLKFFGTLTTNGGTTANGYGLYIPQLTLDGNFSIAVTGTENEVEIPFTPVLDGNNSEPVLIIQL
jgi:hypothetical protein